MPAAGPLAHARPQEKIPQQRCGIEHGTTPPDPGVTAPAVPAGLVRPGMQTGVHSGVEAADSVTGARVPQTQPAFVKGSEQVPI